MSRPEPVLLELSQAQIDRVLREASGASSLTRLLAGLSDVGDALEGDPALLRDTRLSRSLLLGLLLLAALPADGSYMGNSELARKCKVSQSTAHRYISTLIAVGLLERDPDTRRYRLAHAA